MFQKENFSGLILLCVGLLVWWIWPDKDERPQHLSPEITYESPEKPSVVMDNHYKYAMLAIINKYKEAYSKAENEVQKGYKRIERGRELCKILPSNIFQDWEAELKDFSVSLDGSKIDSVTISLDDITTMRDSSLSLKKGDYIYDILFDGLKKKDKVKVSGSFHYDHDNDASDCFYETSFTLSGGMIEPNYLITLSSLAKY